jgi:hypothetical protein
MAVTHFCSSCKTEKPLSSFPIRKTHRPGKPVSQCMTCKNEYNKNHRIKNKEAVLKTEHKSRLKRSYGITVEQYEEMFVTQGKMCKICKADKPGGRTKLFFIDHCHKTQKVRGLLCMRCNTGLGLFMDNPEFLGQAVKYLMEN